MPAVLESEPGSLAETTAILDRARAAREALGADGDFAIDFHGRISPGYARRLLPLLEEFHPLFVEEPVVPELNTAWDQLVASTSIPIATGERLYSRWDMLPVLAAGVSVVQPDLAHAGGISETRRIAVLAETYGAAIAPHCPLGPLALAAALQVDFASSNFLIQEQSLGIHYNAGSAELTDYLVDTEVFRFSDGYIHRPTGPGLGVQIDENAPRRTEPAPLAHSRVPPRGRQHRRVVTVVPGGWCTSPPPLGTGTRRWAILVTVRTSTEPRHRTGARR